MLSLRLFLRLPLYEHEWHSRLSVKSRIDVLCGLCRIGNDKASLKGLGDAG